MPFPLAAQIGLTAGQTLLGASAAKKASRAQSQAADRSIAESRYQYDTARSDLAPYRDIGGQALNDIAGQFGYSQYAAPGPETRTVGRSPFRENDWNAISSKWGTIHGAASYDDISAADLPQGISPEATNFLRSNWGSIRPAANLGDVDWNAFTHAGINYPTTEATQPQAQTGSPQNFLTSPDYGFRRSEGTRNIENTFAAGGLGQSGNALRALTEFSSNLAGSEFGNWFDRRMQLAGQGQNAVNTGVQVGQNTAANVGNAFMNQGDARASGVVGAANSLIGGIDDVSGMIGYRNFLKQPNATGRPRARGSYYGASYDPRYGGYG